MDQPTPPSESPTLCARCLRLLTPGQGDFYLVNIHAIADPTPPSLGAVEEGEVKSGGQTYQELARELNDLSEVEANEQVARKLQINLCGACFPDWFESPA